MKYRRYTYVLIFITFLATGIVLSQKADRPTVNTNVVNNNPQRTVIYDSVTWYKKFDTLLYANRQLGKSMSVDQADQLKAWVTSVISDMARQVNKQ